MSAKTDAAAIVDQLEHEYRASVDALRQALREFLAGGPPPNPDMRRGGAFSYPELRLTWPTGQPFPRISRVKSTVLPIVQRDAGEFRRHKLFDWTADQLKHLNVQQKDGNFTLAMKDKHWKLVAPSSAPVDEVKASDLVSNLSSLHAVEFLGPGDPGSKYGLDSPSVTVSATITQVRVSPPMSTVVRSMPRSAAAWRMISRGPSRPPSDATRRT